MFLCENKCVFATKTFKPFSLKHMSAFVYMVTIRKFHVHDLHVKQPAIIISSITDAMNFFKMTSKPIRQLCSCNICNKTILRSHYCSFCRDSDRGQYLYNAYPNDMAKCHIDHLSYLMYVGKFVEKPEFEPYRYTKFHQFITTWPYRARNCAGESKKCQAISYDKYIERFPPPNRYKWLEESHNIGGDVKLSQFRTY